LYEDSWILSREQMFRSIQNVYAVKLDAKIWAKKLQILMNMDEFKGMNKKSILKMLNLDEKNIDIILENIEYLKKPEVVDFKVKARSFWWHAFYLEVNDKLKFDISITRGGARDVIFLIFTEKQFEHYRNPYGWGHPIDVSEFKKKIKSNYSYTYCSDLDGFFYMVLDNSFSMTTPKYGEIIMILDIFQANQIAIEELNKDLSILANQNEENTNDSPKNEKKYMYCSQCGAKIPRTSKFCMECGYKF